MMRAKGGRTGAALAGLLSLSIVLSFGCGKKAPPFLSKPFEAVRLELSDVQVRDGRVRITFKVPKESFSLGKEEEEWSLARMLRKNASQPEAAFEERAVIREAEGFGFGERHTIVDSGIKGRNFIYRVELRKEESSDVAQSADVVVGDVSIPGVPGRVRAEGREGAVVLSWDPPAGSGEIAYHVFRRGPGQKEPERINPDPLRTANYTDTRIAREKEYCYQVQTFRVDGAVETEGALSAESCARSMDRTPPPAPAKVRLVFSQQEGALSWFPVQAGDLAGYNVYRSAGGGPFLKVNEGVVKGTSFRDRDVTPGEVYRYRVTAVDNSLNANESPYSAVVDGRVP